MTHLHVTELRENFSILNIMQDMYSQRLCPALWYRKSQIIDQTKSNQLLPNNHRLRLQRQPLAPLSIFADLLLIAILYAPGLLVPRNQGSNYDLNSFSIFVTFLFSDIFIIILFYLISVHYLILHFYPTYLSILLSTRSISYLLYFCVLFLLIYPNYLSILHSTRPISYLLYFYVLFLFNTQLTFLSYILRVQFPTCCIYIYFSTLFLEITSLSYTLRITFPTSFIYTDYSYMLRTFLDLSCWLCMDLCIYLVYLATLLIFFAILYVYCIYSKSILAIYFYITIQMQ